MLRFGLLLLFLIQTSELANIQNEVVDFNTKFSYWPSVHNAAKLMRMRRESEQGKADVRVESGANVAVNAGVPDPSNATVVPVPPIKDTDVKNDTVPVPVVKVPGNATVVPTTPTAVNETKPANLTATEKAKELDLNNPGVVKRGFIVFGGFALLAVAYFIFYRKKSNKNDTNNTHSSIDANQFRYGVLQSEDRSDKMELSRVPLTMESDDDDDEDLEIFDLEQKKKSLSYVNLQTNDEDLVFPRNDSQSDRDNLLLDIEDGNSDTLINWSGNSTPKLLDRSVANRNYRNYWKDHKSFDL